MKATPIETPELLVTRAALLEPDTARKIGNKVIGNDKFRLEGFFDPTTSEGQAFVKAVMAAVKEATEDAAAVVRAAFPTVEELIEAARSRKVKTEEDETAKRRRIAAMEKIAARSGARARRLRASTSYGPVSVVLANGRDAAAKDIFPGVTAVAQVTPNVFAAEFKGGEDMLSFWLGPVLIVRSGERLFGGGPNARDVFAARISGGVSDLDLGSEEVPF